MKLRRRRKKAEHCHHALCHPSARPRPELPLPPVSSFSPLLSSSLPPPSPTSPHPSVPACRPPRAGRAVCPSYPSPSCSASPFLLHKITEAEECGGKDRGGVPTLPTQLSYSTITGRRPARRTLVPSPNRMAATSLRFQWHPLCGGWSHRKTKYENELSCSITFIAE